MKKKVITIAVLVMVLVLGFFLLKKDTPKPIDDTPILLEEGQNKEETLNLPDTLIEEEKEGESTANNGGNTTDKNNASDGSSSVKDDQESKQEDEKDNSNQKEETEAKPQKNGNKIVLPDDEW